MPGDEASGDEQVSVRDVPEIEEGPWVEHDVLFADAVPLFTPLVQVLSGGDDLVHHLSNLGLGIGIGGRDGVLPQVIGVEVNSALGNLLEDVAR